MYLLYLDGSGNIDTIADDYVVLAGIAVFESRVHYLARDLDRLAAEIDSAAPHELEFHGAAILGGRSRWRSIRKDDRVAYIHRVLQTAEQSHNSVLFGAAIHKASMLPQDPFEYAFEQLANRFDLYLRRKQLDAKPQRGVIIVDEDAYEKRFQRLARDFRNQGHRWGKLAYLAEVPLFVNSAASRLVQYADLVSYAIYRYYQKSDERFFEAIKHRFDSRGGLVDGLIHFGPKGAHMECPCPSCLRKRRASPPYGN